jgi:hypothetical protein
VEVVDGQLGQPLLCDLRDELAFAGPHDERRSLGRVWVLRVALRELERELDLLRVDVLDGERTQPALLEHVDARPVGDLEDGHLRDRRERAAVVERAAEGRACIDEEPLRRLGTLLVVDVGVGAEPLDDLAALVLHRERARQVPSIRTIRSTTEAKVVLVRDPRVERVLPALERAREIVRVDDVRPAGLDQLFERGFEEVERALVDVVELPARKRRPDLIRLCFGEESVSLLALAAKLGEFLLLEQLRLTAELLGLLVQLNEDRDLGAQHFRVERLEDIVDRAGRVAAEHLLLVLRDGGDEDDGDVLRPLALLDQCGGLEAVELWHRDVEQNDRDVVTEKLAERVLPGMGKDQVLAQRVKDRLEGEEVLGAVVDEQDVRH